DTEHYDVYQDMVQRGPFVPGQPLPPPTQTIHYSGIANLIVRGGSAPFGDTFFVESTSAGTATSLFAGGGRSNEFLIESNGNLDSTLGPVAVHGARVYDFSVVYDYGSASGHTYTLSALNASTSLFQRADRGAITQDGISEMIFYAPVIGGNHVNVLSVPASLF